MDEFNFPDFLDFPDFDDTTESKVSELLLEPIELTPETIIVLADGPGLLRIKKNKSC